jgi:hypothetical protein
MSDVREHLPDDIASALALLVHKRAPRVSAEIDAATLMQPLPVLVGCSSSVTGALSPPTKSVARKAKANIDDSVSSETLQPSTAVCERLCF